MSDTAHLEAVAAYRAAYAGAVVINRSVEGRVRVTGRDRLDLLHRMSTNDINSLAVGEARQTVLTTAIARIVDAPWVLNRGEAVLLVTGAGRATAVRRWLAGYIFFRDEVKLTDASAELGQIGIFGMRAAEIAEALWPGAAALAENRFGERDDVLAWRGRPLAGDGYTLIAPTAQLDVLIAQAVAAGAVPAGDETYQLLRLAAGRPEVGHELTEEYIPLEANLWHAVSFTKGCYIGQEIIARMESRGKLARRLVGLKLSAPVGEGTEVKAGEAVIGKVTSAGVLPDYGPVALAFLKTAQCEPGTAVAVGEAEGTVVGLPFA
ncbi:MAG: glycine cleavage T C-terminal barrel domain-containing protein [Anaerolineales bacterium]|nr:glycine cleavage T C-terminal barrel domain-containing protein [Anaerolineales bacterium]